jgi:hypothetical protein
METEETSKKMITYDQTEEEEKEINKQAGILTRNSTISSAQKRKYTGAKSIMSSETTD